MRCGLPSGAGDAVRIRFDHVPFQRAALWSAAGGAALSAFGPLPVAMIGSAVGVALACLAASWKSRILATCAFAPVALAWAVLPHPWLPWACGGAFGFFLAALRAADAEEPATPRTLSVAFTAVCAAAAVALGSAILPSASASLASLAPPWIARAAAGAALGLWAALCSAPLFTRPLPNPPNPGTQYVTTPGFRIVSPELEALERELRAAAARAIAEALRRSGDTIRNHP